MKYIAIAFLLASTAAEAIEGYQWPIIRVIDGDTLETRLNGLPDPLQKVKVRFRGVDTPEKGHRAKCEDERRRADQASLFTKEVIEKAKQILFSSPKWGKYGGRIIADVWVDGRNLADLLIYENLARPYNGGKRKGWCGYVQ